jgi:5'-nucleotidase
MAQKAAILKKIRNEEENILLLDAGDIFQGTPYFNYYGGELEMKLMSEMKYDAATIGNHDFDAGLDGLKKQLKHANFPLIVTNYDFSDTVMNGLVTTHKIFKRAGVKVGVFGLGIELQGLVPQKLSGTTRYSDPVLTANATAKTLRENYKCDMIICLSHLGYKYETKKISDIFLAENTSNIDLIIGGHTHTFMEQPDVRKNLQNEEVVINQVGWAGICIGRLDYFFEKKFNKKRLSGETVLVH